MPETQSQSEPTVGQPAEFDDVSFEYDPSAYKRPDDPDDGGYSKAILQFELDKGMADVMPRSWEGHRRLREGDYPY